MVNSIFVGQGQWAFTSSDKDQSEMTTCSFGPCFVVTFTAKKYAALAHVDASNQIESIQKIFDRFQEHDLSVQEIHVVLMGGWAKEERCQEWGNKILYFLDKAGVQEQRIGWSKLFASSSFLPGAKVDAKSGETVLFDEKIPEIEQIGKIRGLERAIFVFSNPFVESPLTEAPYTE